MQPVIGHAAGNVPGRGRGRLLDGGRIRAPRARAPRGDGRSELHRSQLLAEIAALKRCLAVTGTHGKTTTTGMIAHVMRGCGLDPAYVVGGELRSTGANAAWGTGEWIVIEADESDRSLLALDPEIACLTNAVAFRTGPRAAV